MTGELLSYDTKELIKRQTKERLMNISGDEGNFKNYTDLLNKRNCSISINLFLLWYIGSYVYYGLIYILPEVLQEYHKNKNKHTFISKTDQLTSEQYDRIISDIIMSCCFEIPSDISNSFTPNIKYLGRKGAMIVGFFFSAIFSIMCLIHPDFMPLYASFIKFYPKYHTVGNTSRKKLKLM